MIHPHLKLTSPKPFTDFVSVQYARLLEPAVDVHNDSDLYAAVQEYGRAVILPYDGVLGEAMPAVKLTPEEFQSKWCGD